MHTIYNGACGAHLITERAYGQGELICAIDQYRIVSEPTYQTIQIGQNMHLEELGIVAYMNHSCRPNTIIDTTSLTIRAVRDIQAGEDISFFYPSTEWEMDRPFICLCGAPGCIRLVAGARYLSVDVLHRYFINQHIRELIAAALTQPVPSVPYLQPALEFQHNGYTVNGKG